MGVSLTSNDPDAVAKAAQYDAMAAQFLEAGVSIADVFETADPELIERAKQLSQDEKAAAVATKTKETPQSINFTIWWRCMIGAADIVNEATRIKRNLDGAEYFGEFDSLVHQNYQKPTQIILVHLMEIFQGWQQVRIMSRLVLTARPLSLNSSLIQTQPIVVN